MSDLVKKFDKLPWILRLILAIPFFDAIVYGIYRIAKGKVWQGIVWFVLGSFFIVGSIIDIVCIILHKKVTVWA